MDRYWYKKASIGWTFALEGIYSGAFSGSGELFKENNKFSEETFGWVIFLCVAAGISVVVPVAKICDAYGSGPFIFFSALVLVLTTPFMAYFTVKDGELVMLLVCVITFGVFMAALDICINAQACCFEKLTGGSHMGFMHAVFALGAAIGSTATGVLIRADYTFFDILCVVSAFAGLVTPLCWWGLIGREEELKLNDEAATPTDGSVERGGGDAEFDKLSAVASRMLQPLRDVSVPMKTFSSSSSSSSSPSSNYEFLRANADDDDDSDAEMEIAFNDHLEGGGGGMGVGIPPSDSSSSMRGKGIKILAALTFILAVAFLVEGSIGDWSAIYLAEDCRVPRSSGLDALGYTVFEIFTVISRLLTDKVADRVSRPLLLKLCTIFSLMGFWFTASAPLFLPANHDNNDGDMKYYGGALGVAAFGYAVTGLALGPISAVVMAGAGQVPGVEPTWAISTVSGVSYIGLLIGPLLLGSIAENLSLSVSWFTAGLLTLLILPCTALV